VKAFIVGSEIRVLPEVDRLPGTAYQILKDAGFKHSRALDCFIAPDTRAARKPLLERFGLHIVAQPAKYPPEVMELVRAARGFVNAITESKIGALASLDDLEAALKKLPAIP
jgi:hypothetical protein